MSRATKTPVPTQRSTLGVLVAGDAAVFALFTAIGIRNHAVGFTAYHFLRDFIPLTLCWFLVAVIVDTYGRGGAVRVGLNWFIGVTAGIIVRKWWVGGPNGKEFWTFMAVALVTNGVFLVVWRFLAARLLSRGRPGASVAGAAGEGEVL